jgi:hypothetical protein
MFRHLPIYSHDPRALAALGDAMIQELEDGKIDKPLGFKDDDENTSRLPDGQLRLPAGYTYFGQFVDHDITFDPASSLTRQNDPNALVDFRTPRFDLDSLYGRGPADQPYMYDADGLRLVSGDLVDAETTSNVGGPDLPRAAGHRAIIGDPRNDENKIVSQLQSAFIEFHRRVVDHVRAEHPKWNADDTFKVAQQTVRWHYQWVVIHDFLVRLVGQAVVDNILEATPYVAASDPPETPPNGGQRFVRARLLFFSWRDQPFMPIEFSVAAYRYGHSMIRPSYFINDVVTANPPVDIADRIPVFFDGSPTQNLASFDTLPAQWGVQWKYFLPGIKEAAGPRDGNLPQPSYKIDGQLVFPLRTLPDNTARAELVVEDEPPEIAKNLAVRNLLRADRLGVPSGQDVARAMGVEPVGDAELFDGLELSDEFRTDLEGHTPLWYYVLKEAEKRGAGGLGPVGGRIVAEVLIGLLDGDPLSYLSVQPNWTPTLDAATPGTFTLTDLINFAHPDRGGATPTTYH